MHTVTGSKDANDNEYWLVGIWEPAASYEDSDKCLWRTIKRFEVENQAFALCSYLNGGKEPW